MKVYFYGVLVRILKFGFEKLYFKLLNEDSVGRVGLANISAIVESE